MRRETEFTEFMEFVEFVEFGETRGWWRLVETGRDTIETIRDS
jgi:hypothetical protein